MSAAVSQCVIADEVLKDVLRGLRFLAVVVSALACPSEGPLFDFEIEGGGDFSDRQTLEPPLAHDDLRVVKNKKIASIWTYSRF